MTCCSGSARWVAAGSWGSPVVEAMVALVMEVVVAVTMEAVTTVHL